MDKAYLLKSLMDTISDAIYFKDRQSRFIMVNQACARKHGWDSPDEIVGRSDFDVFAAEHAEQTFADEQHIIATGEPLIGIEEKETWLDGSETWVSSSKMPLRDSNGEIIGIFGITRDITQRKKDELRVHKYVSEIRLIKEQMEEDFQVAAEMQKTFFTSSYPVFPEGSSPENRCVEFLHRLRSGRKISGDYCYIHRVSDTEAGIFLCDVQGVGVRAALGTALIRAIVQEIEPQGLAPGAYLSRMNALLMPLVHQENLLLDISACYLSLNVATGQIKLASAGHPVPIHLRRGGEVKWLYENLSFRGPALAVNKATSYPTVACKAGPGDVVVMFSDGLYTVRNTQADPYGEARLLGAARALAGESLAGIFNGLEDDARAFAADGAFSDDVCIVGFELRKLLQ